MAYCCQLPPCCLSRYTNPHRKLRHFDFRDRLVKVIEMDLGRNRNKQRYYPSYLFKTAMMNLKDTDTKNEFH